jgi:hypothetical protein
VCLYEALKKNLNASQKGIFYDYGKIRDVFAKYIRWKVISKWVKGCFANTLYYFSIKNVFTQRFHL